jgi:hypothetical protein
MSASLLNPVLIDLSGNSFLCGQERIASGYEIASKLSIILEGVRRPPPAILILIGIG